MILLFSIHSRYAWKTFIRQNVVLPALSEINQIVTHLLQGHAISLWQYQLLHFVIYFYKVET